MSNINGVPVENIATMKGVAASTIQSISGIATSVLPGWPGGGPTCSDLSLRYGIAPGMACAANASFYSFDAVNNLLYILDDCNGQFAESGFYVGDDNVIYEWNRFGIWAEFGICE